MFVNNSQDALFITLEDLRGALVGNFRLIALAIRARPSD